MHWKIAATMAEGDSPQVRVKLEQQNIKERLNLHVKRRLQHDPDVPTDNFDFPPGDNNNGPTNLKRTKIKETPKQRKPYQKRTEKAKTDTTKCKKGLKPVSNLSDLIVKYFLLQLDNSAARQLMYRNPWTSRRWRADLRRQSRLNLLLEIVTKTQIYSTWC